MRWEQEVNLVPERQPGSFLIQNHTPVTVRPGYMAISETPEKFLPATLLRVALQCRSPFQWGAGAVTNSLRLSLRCTYLHFSIEPLNTSLFIHCSWQRQKTQTLQSHTLAFSFQIMALPSPTYVTFVSPSKTLSFNFYLRKAGILVPCP